ncbi:hypothetical protein F5X98DRAFT_386369 [Xylaria grammica]|nr:hypothetical protein F5X98DRAFT_386369 [Xylaria grammica]
MDPVEKLFRDLPNRDFPTPTEDRAPLDHYGAWDKAHLTRVFESFISSQSHDPDREFVASCAKSFLKTQDIGTLRTELGRFALDKPEIPDDGSAKSQQLNWHAWISQGRKDEEWPFRNKKDPEGQRVDLPKACHAFLPARLMDPKICANCAKPDAEAACGGCLVEVDGHVVTKTAYCNRACQTHHWQEHKPQCLERRKIRRAVSLIYDLFVVYQKNAWADRQLVGIAEKHGIINVINGQFEEWALQGKPFVCRFPSGVALSEEHSLAVLLYRHCRHLLIECQGLVGLLLLPLCQTLQEVQIVPRNAYRPTCDTMRFDRILNNMYARHTVLCATLKSGEQMAVDITGAQYGWRETVAHWGVWTSHREAAVPLHNHFGDAHQSMQLYMSNAPQIYRVSHAQRVSLAQKMLVAIQSKMKENKAPSVSELYKLDDAAFASCKLAMLSSAEEALNNGLRELYESKVGRCYVDAGGRFRATTTKQQTEALERVWLTDEHVRMGKERGLHPAIIYKVRCADRSARVKFEAAGLDMP